MAAGDAFHVYATYTDGSTSRIAEGVVQHDMDHGGIQAQAAEVGIEVFEALADQSPLPVVRIEIVQVKP